MNYLVKAEPREVTKAQPLYIFACPNPFTLERKRVEVHDRRISIREIVTDLQPNRSYSKGAFVAVNGERIVEEDWNYFYPAPGSVIDIRVVPKGFIAPIIVAVAAVLANVGAVAGLVAATGLTVAELGMIGVIVGAVASLAVSVIGYIVLNALVRPPGSTSGGGRQIQEEKDTPAQYITGARNQAVPYGVIPRVYGKIRMLPPLAASGYTDLKNISTVPFDWTGGVIATKSYGGPIWTGYLTDWLGEDQYLNMAVCWGYGPISLKGLRIATTPLENYQSYTIEHRYGYSEDEPLKFYMNDVYEEAIDVKLTNGLVVTRTTAKHCDEISIDFAFDGLYQNDPYTGKKMQITVGFAINYREVGATTWGPTIYFNCTGSRMSAVRRGLRWATDGGQYEVRVIRGTDDYAGNQYIHCDSYWALLRSIRHTQPVKETGIALTALRIKATDQLQGSIDELSGLVSSILLDWDFISKKWVLRETNNPASIIRDILMGSANNRPLTSDRVDLDNLQDFHQWCRTKGFACNKIFDSSTSIWDALNLVAACGRATIAMVNGKWGVVIDREQDVPVQHFTQRNSWDFKASQGFVDEIHGFRIKFLNEDEDYAEAETTVYMDNYNEDNASKLEDLSLDGVTNYDQIYKLARYFLAVGEWRRESVTFTTDFEHVVCQRGDWIKFSHDVMLIGIQSGRIVGYEDDGTYFTHLILDETVEMGGGISYNIRCRLSNGDTQLLSIVTGDGITDTIELTTPVLMTDPFPEIGDLYTFGEAGTETEDLLVKSIEPGPDLTATIECTLYAPVVFTADQGPIPPYVPKITVPLAWQVPVVSGIYSDGSVLIWSQGTWQSRILVTFTFPTFLPTYTGIEGWYKKTAEVDVTSDGSTQTTEVAGAWFSVTASLSEKELSLMPVEDGAEYDMKFRFVKADGTRGPWTAVYTHTVEGKTAPPGDVTGFSASYFAGLVTLKWNKVADVDVAAYELRYGNVGAGWDDATVIVQALASTAALTVSMPLGTWDIMIKAIDVVGNYSDNTAVYTLEVPSTYQTVYLQTNHLGWPGTLTNYVHNVKTGHLNPSASILATGNNFYLFNSYVYSPTTTSIYTGATITLGAEDTVRVYANIQGIRGAGESGLLLPALQINTGSGWQDWSIGNVKCTAVRFRFTTTASVGLYAITRFDCFIDKEPITESDEVNIGGSGLATVTFSEVFYSAPLIQVSAKSEAGVPRVASIGTVTTTDFLAYLHTTNGTPTNGVITYTATSRGVL